MFNNTGLLTNHTTFTIYGNITRATLDITLHYVQFGYYQKCRNAIKRLNFGDIYLNIEIVTYPVIIISF